MRRILLTGAGGFLGSVLSASAPDHVDLVRLFRSTPLAGTGTGVVVADLADAGALPGLLDEIRPDAIIHTAALSGEAECRADPVRAHAVNVMATARLARYCADRGARMIFTSTDLVFDGRNAPYSEDSPTGCPLAYGRLKAAAEEMLEAYAPHVLTVRLPLLYGLGLAGRKGLLWQFAEACRQGREQRLFTDEYRTPAYAPEVASFIWQLLDMPVSGLLHLGGPQRLSRYELARLFVRYLELPGDNLVPVTRASLNMADRPADTSLNSSLARVLGWNPQPPEDCLARLRREWPA